MPKYLHLSPITYLQYKARDLNLYRSTRENQLQPYLHEFTSSIKHEQVINSPTSDNLLIRPSEQA